MGILISTWRPEEVIKPECSYATFDEDWKVMGKCAGQNRVPAKCGKVGKQQGLFVQILLSISLSWRQKTLFGGKSESPSQI